MAKNLVTVHRWDLDWADDTDVLDLGEGVRVKVLRHDPASEQTDMLVWFPPGYTEPEHTHESEHSIMVLEGEQVVDGERMRPGDYVYGPPNLPHGPFHYPEGCVVFVCFRGKSTVHHPHEGA